MMNFVKKNRMLIDNEALDYIISARSTPALSPQDEAELLEKAARGNNTAFQKLVGANKRMVVDAVLKYIGDGEVMSDVMREGEVGLTVAVIRYKHITDQPFSVYAEEMITRHLPWAVHGRYTEPSVPAEMMQVYGRAKQAGDLIVAEKEEEPTIGMISKRTKLPEYKIELAMKWYGKYGPLLEEIGFEIGPYESTPERESRYYPDEEESDLI